jgi:REP-associated tyrosine transposase
MSRIHRLLRARRGSQGPVRQHQFWDRFVPNEKEFGARMEDMRLNPVRKGLAKKPEDWPWSSG